MEKNPVIELDENSTAGKQDLFLTYSSEKQEARKRFSGWTCRSVSISTLSSLLLMLLIGVVVMVIFKTEVDRLRQQLESLKQQLNEEADPDSECIGTKTTAHKTDFNLHGFHIGLKIKQHAFNTTIYRDTVY